MKKYMASLVSGFGAGVLHIVPIAKSFSCCLVIPFASVAALLLDKKANPTEEKITHKKAAIIGFLTGLYAALFGSSFDIFITLVTKNNDIVATFTELQKMVHSLPLTAELKSEVLRLFELVRDEIITYGFSPLYAFSVLINNFIINSIMGTIGGLIGAQIINKRSNNPVE